MNFILGKGVNPSCPSLDIQCRDNIYLVPGNLVVLGRENGEIVSAQYDNVKSSYAVCLPISMLEASSLLSSPSDWVGVWRQAEATTKIKVLQGVMTVAGNATYGVDDPERVARGDVNLGSLKGTLAIKDGAAAYIEAGGEPSDESCRVRMARAGDALFVQDNGKCGGMSVRFDGMYTRRSK